jgi:hypothetical protein
VWNVVLVLKRGKEVKKKSKAIPVIGRGGP